MLAFSPQGCTVLFPSAPCCPILPFAASHCPVGPHTAQIFSFLSIAVGIRVGDMNGGKGGVGATCARTWTSGGGSVVVEAGGGGASAENIDGGAVSATSIGRA